MANPSYRWCFFDPGQMDYHPDSPEQIPLGGSQAALAYLCRELVKQGQAVTLVNQTRGPGEYAGVKCLNQSALSPEFWQKSNFDLVVSLNHFQELIQLPGSFKRVFWNQHNPQVKGIEKLAEAMSRIDQLVYVSQWQRDAYASEWGIHAKTSVCRNACPPFYQALHVDPIEFVQARPGPLTLAYTSTPFRGLKLLIAIFPGLRQLFPDLRLKVFSSLKVYQENPQIESEYESLYQECQALAGVEYHGSIPQSQLYQELKHCHILAYPNIYSETSCIAVMEAMAAGCHVITTELAALPETCAGFATLVPDPLYQRELGLLFFEALCQLIARFYQDPLAMAEHSLQQSQFALTHYAWSKRAQEWIQLAGRLV